MIRRPPTSIELQVSDIQEYETLRREQQILKEEAASKSKSAQEVPTWNPGPKPKQEVYERIGYVPPQSLAGRSSPSF